MGNKTKPNQTEIKHKIKKKPQTEDNEINAKRINKTEIPLHRYTINMCV